MVGEIGPDGRGRRGNGREPDGAGAVRARRARGQIRGKRQLEARLGQQGPDGVGHWGKMVGVGHWGGIPDRELGSSQEWGSSHGMGYQTQVGFQTWDDGVPDRGLLGGRKGCAQQH